MGTANGETTVFIKENGDLLLGGGLLNLLDLNPGGNLGNGLDLNLGGGNGNENGGGNNLNNNETAFANRKSYTETITFNDGV